jgi:hypothetical protein
MAHDGAEFLGFDEFFVDLGEGVASGDVAGGGFVVFHGLYP